MTYPEGTEGNVWGWHLVMLEEITEMNDAIAITQCGQQGKQLLLLQSLMNEFIQ